MLSSNLHNRTSKSGMKSLLEQSFNAIIQSCDDRPLLPPSTKDEITSHLDGCVVSTSRLKAIITRQDRIDPILHLLVLRKILVKFDVGNGLELYAAHDYFEVLSVQTVEPLIVSEKIPVQHVSPTTKQVLHHSTRNKRRVSQPYKSPMLNKQVLPSPIVSNRRVTMIRSASAGKSSPLKVSSTIDHPFRNDPEIQMLETEKRQLEIMIDELEEIVRKKRLFQKHQETNDAQKLDTLIQKWLAVSKEALVSLRDTIGVMSVGESSSKRNGFDTGDFGWHEEMNPIVLLMKAFKKDRDENDEQDEGESRLMTLKEVATKFGFDIDEIGEYDAENDCFK